MLWFSLNSILLECCRGDWVLSASVFMELDKYSTMNKIKLCGYLKKKRNKVGGWRKLWFVLHDHLLVSYSSKEEYDNKLVSFKDILNLVPGTQVRPIDEFRFTIETTTHTIYTFHCDDHVAYREWIAMLLDSAGSSLNCSRRFHYFFTRDPMRNSQRKIKNCDSANGAEHNDSEKHTNLEKDCWLQKGTRGNFYKPTENIWKSSSNEGPLKSQLLKKQIERMSISGRKEHRRITLTPHLEETIYSKTTMTQSTELSMDDKLTMQPCEVGDNLETERPKTSEPVYAVVDLKTKHDQRKKRSALLAEKHCNSYESIYQISKDKDVHKEKEKSLESLNDVVYEDGDLICKGGGQYILDESSEGSHETEENIYEPINIEQKTSMFEFRKYISRLRLTPFLRTVSSRKLKTNSSDIKTSSSNGPMSRFSTLRWKFGKHRKSVQRKMRKFYSNNYEPNPLFTYNVKETKTEIVPARDKSRSEALDEDQTENVTQKPSGKVPLKKTIRKISIFNIASTKN